MSAPRFTHDCYSCTFIGQWQGQDVYTHGDTILVRHGNDGPAYYSFEVKSYQVVRHYHRRNGDSHFEWYCVKTPRVIELMEMCGYDINKGIIEGGPFDGVVVNFEEL